jgi:hypothetical protein
VVNREASRPLDSQIKTVLELKILSCEWTLGNWVSSETRAAMCDVGRITARLAIEQEICLRPAAAPQRSPSLIEGTSEDRLGRDETKLRDQRSGVRN